MSKPDFHISLFLEGETGKANIDTRKYEREAWTIEDYDQAISLLQYGISFIYKQKNRLFEEKEKIKSEIDKLIE